MEKPHADMQIADMQIQLYLRDTHSVFENRTQQNFAVYPRKQLR